MAIGAPIAVQDPTRACGLAARSFQHSLRVPEMNVHLLMFVKFLIAGAAVTWASTLAARGNTIVSALIGTFPYITALVLAFSYLDTGQDRVNLMVLSKHFAFMIFATGLFPLMLFVVLKAGLPVGHAVISALVVMATTQALLYYLFRGDLQIV